MAENQKMKLGTLTAMVVGGMVGAGVFSLPRNFAQATGVYVDHCRCRHVDAGLRIPEPCQPQD